MTPHTSFDFQTEYDEYIENTPLEARFDPMTIQMLVVEAVPKHAAYEMMFEEYLKERTRFIDYDNSEKKRLSFYLPTFPAMRSMDFAFGFGISIHRFNTVLLELGLITFLFDYHTEISTIKDTRKNIGSYITDRTTQMRYMQIDSQKISVGSCNGYRKGDTKHFAPNVQEWLYNAIGDTAAYLNMSISDIVYLCWCIGAQKTLPMGMVDTMLNSEFSNILDAFNISIKIQSDNILFFLSKINDGH